MAGAIRIGSTVSAAMTNRRVLEPIEAHIALIAGRCSPFWPYWRSCFRVAWPIR